MTSATSPKELSLPLRPAALSDCKCPSSSSSEIEVFLKFWTCGLASRKKTIDDNSKSSYEAAIGAHTFETLREQCQKLPESWRSHSQNDIVLILDALEQTALLFSQSHCDTLENWTLFSQTLDEVRQNLQKLDSGVRGLGVEVIEPNITLLSETIIKVFLAILDIWINTFLLVKSRHINMAAEENKTTRENYMKSINKRVLHFCDIAPTRIQMKQQESFVTSPTIEDGISFPLKVLRYPAYNSFFGRKELLAKIDYELRPEPIFQRDDVVKSVLLHGTGGVGKTQIALAYAHRNPAGFDAIFWIRSDIDANIQADLASIALDLNLEGAKRDGDAKGDENLLYFKRWLGKQAAMKHGKRWLIIFDNCDKIEDIYPKYIPKTKGSVLITSRFQSVKLPDSVILPVQPFDKDEGLRLMKKLLYSEEEKQLSKSEERSLLNLLQKVDGLPLGIKVIVALMLPRIDRNSKNPIAIFRKNFEQHSRALLTRVERTTDYDRDDHRKVGQVHVLDNVWQMSFTSLDPNAISMLGMLSFMAPQDISISWFNLIHKEIPPSHSVLSICTKPDDLDWAIVDLNSAALITKQNQDPDLDGDESNLNPESGLEVDTGDESANGSDSETNFSREADDRFSTTKISIHRLIQEAFIYSRPQQECQKIFDAAIHVISKAFPKQIDGETLEGETETCSRLIPHVMSLASRYNELESHGTSPLVATTELGNLLKSCLWYVYEKGERETSLVLLKLAYKVYQDQESEVYADFQFKAGSIHLDHNDLGRCRDAWEKARDIYRRLIASGNESAKESLTWVHHALGNLESADGNVDEALRLYSIADEERKQERSVQSWREGLTSMTSGRAYYLKGEYKTATKRFANAEEIFRREYANSTWMAYLKYAYGNVELAQGNLEEAKKNYSLSRECWIKSAPTHLGLSACYYKLGCIEFEQQNHKSALDHFRKALKIAKFQAVGDQARILRKQSKVHADGGSVGQAEIFRKEAEETRLKISGQGGCKLEDTDKAWDSLVCIFWR
ncbi:hypothetical protein BP6252_05025 [Coleophoma cylindrospora]|uniref:NB-ARC domain-containing protein n=1 Tax=Coleophoma cylindrospora TaxID=1849047 RepID=A0A3D8RSB1_9HELO|nr:hypothetical protein BP6252_05025 [Coleophoma cylindrospora]